MSATHKTVKKAARTAVAGTGRPRSPAYRLRLYIAGQTSRSLAALANLKLICEDHLHGQYEIEVIDLFGDPQLAAGDQILAVPTLVRTWPLPLRRIVGDLTDPQRVLVGLDLRAKQPPRGSEWNGTRRRAATRPAGILGPAPTTTGER